MKNRKKISFFLVISLFFTLCISSMFLKKTGERFDKDYYIKSYPDVKNSKLPPLQHYKQIGWKEGKNPNSGFDNDLYKTLYFTKDEGYRIKDKCKARTDIDPLSNYLECKKQNIIRFKHSSEFKKAVPLKKPKHYLAVATMFQNEARFLKEWIEFYRIIGVEHFYLYNHNSTDNFMEVLQPYIDEGIVELKTITEVPKDRFHWSKIQTSGYSDAINKSKDNTEWLLVIDSDEFLFPVKGYKLSEALEQYDEYAAIGVNWDYYGTSSINLKSGDLLIDKMRKRAKRSSSFTKAIVKPRYVKEIYNPHFAVLKPGYMQVREDKKYFYGRYTTKLNYNILKINHYWSRDLKFFNEKKLKREHIANPQAKTNIPKKESEKVISGVIKKDKEMSKIYDDSIIKYVDELRSRLGQKKAVIQNNQ